jgi:hypothetical protein
MLFGVDNYDFLSSFLGLFKVSYSETISNFSVFFSRSSVLIYYFSKFEF